MFIQMFSLSGGFTVRPDLVMYPPLDPGGGKIPVDGAGTVLSPGS